DACRGEPGKERGEVLIAHLSCGLRDVAEGIFDGEIVGCGTLFVGLRIGTNPSVGSISDGLLEARSIQRCGALDLPNACVAGRLLLRAKVDVVALALAPIPDDLVRGNDEGVEVLRLIAPLAEHPEGDADGRAGSGRDHAQR